jgi:hypothetical protein
LWLWLQVRLWLKQLVRVASNAWQTTTKPWLTQPVMMALLLTFATVEFSVVWLEKNFGISLTPALVLLVGFVLLSQVAMTVFSTPPSAKNVIT